MSTELDPRVIRRVADMHAVYRMFDGRGRLLYVGLTGHARRFDQHSVKRWFPAVASISLEWHDTRAAAMVAERRAIAAERPRYNLAGREPARRRPIETVPAPAELGLVTLSDAVKFRVVRRSLDAVRKASQRPGFPEPKGQRNLAREYDPLELAEWDAS